MLELQRALTELIMFSLPQGYKTMNNIVKHFIEKNIDLLDCNELEEFFKHAALKLSGTQIYELSEVLENIGIETEDARWKVFSVMVIKYINDYTNLPSFLRDKSNSWARLHYMLEEISNLGFGWQDAKDYVLKHQKELGLECRALAPEYGWQDAGDYAFQWFDSVEYDKEYNYK